jgi:hypothetical protein
MSEFYKDFKSIDFDKQIDGITLPTTTRKEFKKITKWFTTKVPKEYHPIYLLQRDGNDYTVANNVLVREKTETYTNVDVAKYKNGDEEMELHMNFTDGRRPDVKVGDKKQLSGSAAVLAFAKEVNVSPSKKVVLHHSGFSIIIAPVTEHEWLNLNISMANDTISYGLTNNFTLFSNAGVKNIEYVFDLLRKKITATSLNIKNVHDVIDYISIYDIPVILLALTNMFYPKGFEYNTMCVNSTKQNEDGNPSCTNRFEGKLSGEKMLFWDKTKFTDEQLSQLALNKSGTVNLDVVEKYRESIDQSGVIELNPTTKIVLRHPTVKEHIEYGNKWLLLLEKRLQTALKTSKDNKNEDVIRGLIMQPTIANEYLHFIKEVTINGSSVKDVNPLMEILEMISADKNLYETFLRGINKYINDSVNVVVGIPNFVCDQCGSLQGDEKEVIIPLNLNSVFLTIFEKYIEGTLRKANELSD